MNDEAEIYDEPQHIDLTNGLPAQDTVTIDWVIIEPKPTQEDAEKIGLIL